MAVFMRLITVNRSVFFCWCLFNPKTVFSFFEMSFYLLVEVFVISRTTQWTGVSCLSVSFLIFSCSSFIFDSYLLLFLICEFDNFFDGLFPCFLYLLVWLSKPSFSCMVGLLLSSVFLVLLRFLVGVFLAYNISW